MSIKRLRSVIQSTAHHAVSGLCYVHPHLGKACKSQCVKVVEVNLLEPGYAPSLLIEPKELFLSTGALREKFVEILHTEEIGVSELREASITFEFLNDVWPRASLISVKTTTGQVVEAAVGSDGNSA